MAMTQAAIDTAVTPTVDPPTEITKTTSRTTTPARRTTATPSARPLNETIEARERLTARIERDRKEDKSGLIYMVLLGGAACLALTGVVRTAMVEPTATSPDAPPPAVFEQPAE